MESKTNPRVIRITGKGQLRVRPDLVRLTLNIESLSKTYEDAIQKSMDDIAALKAALLPCGFMRTDLKTLDLDIQTEYESYKVKDTYKRRFVGYRSTHKLKLEFDIDNERLGNVLGALAGCPVRPEYRLSYTVKDEAAVKNQLLGNAVADARAKAEVLTGSAGVALGEIRSIDYSWGRMDIEVTAMEDNGSYFGEPTSPTGLPVDIEPDDIELSDTVTIVWEIL